MNKYDFGYELEENSTNQWAYQKIRQGSRVLEIGASNGRLTKHLKNEKNCVVDIVEINEEAGEIASYYAECALLGEERGNIESEHCLELLRDKTYDYIIFLDVLEHLINPEKTLWKMKEHLREQGSILVSIPNIAHNSILINLLHNKFQYTKLGLLDDTHVHFFTNESFREMAHQAGYSVVENGAIQKLVGDTEIQNSYDELPREVSAYLRTREQADVYQILFELKAKKDVYQDVKLNVLNLKYTGYRSAAYSCDGNRLIKECIAKVPELSFVIELTNNELNQTIRIDLLNKNCILRNLKIFGVLASGKMTELDISKMNGFLMAPDLIAFWDDDPQVFVDCADDMIEIMVSGECVAYDTNVLTLFEPLVRVILNTKSDLVNERLHVKEYEKSYQELLKDYQTTEKIRDNIEKQYRKLEKLYYDLEEKNLNKKIN